MIDKKKEPRGRERFLSDKERSRLLVECRNSEQPWLYLIVAIALFTGARRGEILGLKRQDVDLEKGNLIFRDTKNGDIRSVPLQGPPLKLMREHLAVPRIDTDLVFPGATGPIDIKKSWTSAMRRAGLENFRFHDLRHSAASYMLAEGWSLAQIGEILGHRSTQTTHRYAHLAQKLAKEKIRQLCERYLS